MAEWHNRTVEMEIKKGARGAWWLVKIGDQKFVMKEVPTFYGEESDEKESPFKEEEEVPS